MWQRITLKEGTGSALTSPSHSVESRLLDLGNMLWRTAIIVAGLRRVDLPSSNLTPEPDPPLPPS